MKEKKVYCISYQNDNMKVPELLLFYNKVQAFEKFEEFKETFLFNYMYDIGLEVSALEDLDAEWLAEEFDIHNSIWNDISWDTLGKYHRLKMLELSIV